MGSDAVEIQVRVNFGCDPTLRLGPKTKLWEMFQDAGSVLRAGMIVGLGADGRHKGFIWLWERNRAVGSGLLFAVRLVLKGLTWFGTQERATKRNEKKQNARLSRAFANSGN